LQTVSPRVAQADRRHRVPPDSASRPTQTLPQLVSLAMAFVRPVHEAENRLARFNTEKHSILAEVERRVVEGRLAGSRRGGDASLEYVLNDVAFQEIRRLEKSGAKGRRQAAEWRDLARRLGGMTDEEKRRQLERLVARFAADVCGN